MIPFEEERYSLPEVARRLRVHVATVWRWTLAGVRGRKLRTVFVGGRRFVLAADLQDFLAAGNQTLETTQRDLRARAKHAGTQLDGLGVRAASPNIPGRKAAVSSPAPSAGATAPGL